MYLEHLTTDLTPQWYVRVETTDGYVHTIAVQPPSDGDAEQPHVVTDTDVDTGYTTVLSVHDSHQAAVDRANQALARFHGVYALTYVSVPNDDNVLIDWSHIIALDEPAPLYLHYDDQPDPQPAYLEIDDDGIILAGPDREIGAAIPTDVWSGYTQTYVVAPNLTADAVRQLVADNWPLIVRVRLGMGGGSLTDDAADASAKLRRAISPTWRAPTIFSKKHHPKPLTIADYGVTFYNVSDDGDGHSTTEDSMSTRESEITLLTDEAMQGLIESYDHVNKPVGEWPEHDIVAETEYGLYGYVWLASDVYLAFARTEFRGRWVVDPGWIHHGSEIELAEELYDLAEQDLREGDWRPEGHMPEVESRYMHA